ncbi:MAG: AAA family ATPase [Tissierellia bacterium]|nr:AAA family ATPase [Tissierellia bacterium]
MRVNHYIQSIELHNFQSHENTFLEFHPGVNVIVGASDVGKSAIIRALKWVFFNEPRGDFFMRHGTNSVSVKITYSDGTTICRKREKNFNGYEITRNGETEKYQGFGIDVPQEVKDITGVEKFALAEDDQFTVNFQSQLEGTFLLSETASKKAKAIGAISGVNIIDEATRKAIRLQDGAKSRKKDLETEKETLEKRLLDFSKVDEDRKRLNELSDWFQVLEKKDKTSNEYKHLLKEYVYTLEFIERGNKYLEKFVGLDEYETSFYDLQKKYNTYTMLNNLKDNKTRVEKEENHLTILKEQLKHIPQIENVSGNLERITSNYRQLTTSKCHFDSINHAIENELGILEDLKHTEELQTAVHQIEEKLSRLKSIYGYSLNLKSMKEMESRLAKYVETFSPEIAYNFERELERKVYQLNAYVRFFQELNDCVKGYNVLNREIQHQEAILNETTEELIHLVQQHKICPFCGSAVDENHIENIKKEYTYGI